MHIACFCLHYEGCKKCATPCYICVIDIDPYRHFFPRAAEHMGISNLTGKRVKNVKESAISDHLLQCDCTTDFDHFDILASDTNSFRLLIKESLLVKHDKPVLNRIIKSFPLKIFDSFVSYAFSLLYYQDNIFNNRIV